MLTGICFSKIPSLGTNIFPPSRHIWRCFSNSRLVGYVSVPWRVDYTPPWRINGWNLQITHLKRKMIRTKPPGNYVPAVNLQRCSRWNPMWPGRRRVQQNEFFQLAFPRIPQPPPPPAKEAPKGKGIKNLGLFILGDWGDTHTEKWTNVTFWKKGGHV